MNRRFVLFTVSLALGYLLVCSLGLLLLIRPWEMDSSDFLLQKPHIAQHVFFSLQIPGLIPLAFLMQPSLIEMLIFLGGVFLLIATLLHMGKSKEQRKLKAIRKASFTLFFASITLRLLYTLLTAQPEDIRMGDAFDLRNNMVMFSWLNFESTLIVALTLIHLWLIRSSKSVENQEPEELETKLIHPGGRL